VKELHFDNEEVSSNTKPRIEPSTLTKATFIEQKFDVHESMPHHAL